MVEYKSTGVVTPLVFDDCECEIPTQVIYAASPMFYTTLSGNQAVTEQGYVTVQFDTLEFDETNEYSTTDYGITAATDRKYDFEANISVYSATDEQVPSYIELYDAENSTVIAKAISGTTVDHIAEFYIRISQKSIDFGAKLVIRYYALGACTIYSSNSWFSGKIVG